MIQRIQSVFLLIAAVVLGSLFRFPFATSNLKEAPFFQDLMFSVTDHSVLMVLALLAAGVSLVNIFLFNNRPLQLRLGYVAIILSLFTGIVAFWLIYSNASSWSQQLELNDGLGIYLTIIALGALVASNFFISKDEKTVRSMDRLR